MALLWALWSGTDWVAPRMDIRCPALAERGLWLSKDWPEAGGQSGRAALVHVFRSGTL